MGKSPAKWIKTVLFGKKSSKSSVAKNVTIERRVVSKASAGDPVPTVSDPSCVDTGRGGEKMELDKGTTAGLPCDVVTVPFPVGESVDLESSTTLIIAEGAELTRLEEAATKAQAAFRGYLARRAFRALKGIIRLQALIRGHLVRRQAVATLRCMQAVVKFQALARGNRVRISCPGLQVRGKYRIDETKNTRRTELSGVNASQKLSTNKFARKLLASLPTAMPLSLQYDLAEPNSAWNWLERWSLLCFWEPLPQPRKILDTKVQLQPKQASSHVAEPPTARSRRTIRKAPVVSNSDNNASNSSETEKPKRNPRKIVNHQTESVQEQPQTELERVKRSLRKVSASTATASDKPELETEKTQEGPKNVSNFPAPSVPDLVVGNSSEKLNAPPATLEKPSPSDVPSKLSSAEAPPKLSSTDAPTKLSPRETPAKLSSTEAPPELSLTDASPKLSLTEASPKLLATEAPSEPLNVDEEVDAIQEGHPVDENNSENGYKAEVNHTVNEDLSSKEDQASKENQKSRRRRSLPAKQEYPENVSQNTPSLPSYMAATESAKAKLRGQSTRLGEDGNGAENGFVRRHSLPSSTNTKLASVSPRVHKSLQANGKGGNKSSKQLSSSKDGNNSKQLSSSKDDKALQPGWKR